MKLAWHVTGTRVYETGVDRGVLYLSGKPGVPWNGLTSVSESKAGGDAQPYYVDGVKYLNLATSEEFAATITAYSAPNEFLVCSGMAGVQNGLFADQQRRQKFGFAYRSKMGNDSFGIDYGYKIHIVYNALAGPSTRNYKTTNNSPEAMELSWDITTIPEYLSTFRPTAHFVVDSTKADPIALGYLESILYGTTQLDPRLPTPTELKNLFGFVPTRPIPGPVNILGEITTPVKSITNLLTNPDSEASSATVVVWKNLLANSGFETAGSEVIIRTNYAQNPLLVNGGSTRELQTRYSWSLAYSPIGTVPAPGVNNMVRITPTATNGPGSGYGWDWGSNSDLASPSAATMYSITAGQNASVSAYMRGSKAFTARAAIRFWDDVNKVWTSALITATLAYSGAGWIRPSVTSVAPANTTHFVGQMATGNSDTWTTADFLDVALPFVGINDIGGSPFGGTVQAVPDSDLTASFVGTANNSNTKLAGIGVAGITPSNSFVIQSSQWSRYGSKSARIIANHSTNRSYFEFTGTPAPAGVVTGLATVRTTAVIPTGYVRALTLGVGFNTGNPATLSTAAPNVAGESDIRITDTMVNPGRFLLFSDTKAGDPDVWFDAALLVAGSYSGPYFDGAVQNAIRQNIIGNATPPVGVGTPNRWTTNRPANGTVEVQTGNEVVYTITTGGLGFTEGLVAQSAVGDSQLRIGRTYSGRIEVKAEGSLIGRTGSAILHDGLQISNTASFTYTGNWQTIDITAGFSKTSINVIGIYVYITGAIVGDVLRVRNPMVDMAPLNTPLVGEFFNGNSIKPGFSYAFSGPANAATSIEFDSDLAVRFTGTAQNSPSELYGNAVFGITSNANVVIRSTRWVKSGLYSMRIIPTSATNTDSFASVTVPTAGRNGGTIIATRYQEGAVSATIANRYLRPVIFTPEQAPPNSAIINAGGEQEMRFTYTLPLTSVYSARLYHGGKVNSGDVWWDLAMLTGDSYSGPAFNGRTLPFIYSNVEMIPKWDGTADASTSHIEYWTEFLTPASQGDAYIIAGNLWVYNSGAWGNYGPVPTI